MVGCDLHDPGCDREHIEQPLMGKLGIDILGCRIFGDLEPALRRACTLEELDCDSVVRQVLVIDPVARDALALGPLGTELCDLLEPLCELVGGRKEHRDLLAGCLCQRALWHFFDVPARELLCLAALKDCGALLRGCAEHACKRGAGCQGCCLRARGECRCRLCNERERLCLFRKRPFTEP